MSDLLHAPELSWPHIYFPVISSTNNTFRFRVFSAGSGAAGGGKSDDTRLLDWRRL
jgi:hypothetical protein